jgi:hypothetical protein
MLVRITAITTFTPGWITYFAAVAPTGESVRLFFDQNQMCADGTGMTRTCVAYNTSEDLWRIREAGGMLVFEVGSTGGAMFRTVASAPVTFALDAIRPRFGTLTDRVTNSSIGLAIDRFN